MNKVWNWMQENKDKIYYATIAIFFLLAIIYSVRGYHYYQSLEMVKDSKDLLGRIFSPFVLACLRFIIVMMLGIFVAMNVIANPLKRLKVMQFEVEFAEIAKTQEKQLNQFHFLSSVLKQNEYFIGRVIDSGDIPYENTIQEILTKYEEFFDQELHINISTQVCVYNPEADFFSKPEYNRIAKKLAVENDPDKMIVTRKKVFGDTNFLMAIRDEFEEKFIVLIESNEHIFTDYDKEVMKGIMEFGKNVCDTVVLLE
ncbi:hypothetical protein [Shouchella clausii]|nr:hypothetical protein [Shouchella clausii]PAD94027.1 hypothetical protein CHH52_01285 [Shouchella clausii]